MPIVSIPIAARDALMLLADAERDAATDYQREWAQAEANGFFKCLRAEYPSETVGLLAMDYDCRLAGESLFTDCLPRIVTGATP